MPQPFRLPKLGKNDSWLRIVAVIVVLGIGLYSAWQREKEQQRADQRPPANEIEEPRLKLPPIAASEREATPESEPPRVAETPAAEARRIIPGQSIRDQNGRLVFRGDIDVGATLTRISRNERLDFAHDGIVFQNRERRLPRKPANYYREYVHPTPGLGGPGPQRIVTGREGEIYYTPDHYRSFRRLD
jgi:ribonuclease T1